MICRAILSVLVSGLLLATAGCTTGPSQSAGEMTLARAQALAAERGVPMLLDFYTDW